MAEANAFLNYLNTLNTGSNDFNILLDLESKNKQFNDQGEPLTSSAGAIGVAQVMPKTAPEAADLAGLEFDDYKYKNDLTYNKQLGKAYFTKQLETFADASKAAAAYNAGPTAVNKAIKNYGDRWLDHLPQETQNYVKSFSQRKLDKFSTKEEVPIGDPYLAKTSPSDSYLQVSDRLSDTDNSFLSYLNQNKQETVKTSDTEDPNTNFLNYLNSQNTISPTKSFVKGFLGSASTAAAASPAMSLGAESLFALGTALGGPAAPITGPVGGIVGGVGGYLLGEKAVRSAYDKYMPESLKKFTGYDEATRQAEREANPESSYGGELTGNVVLFRPGSLKPITLPGGKVISPFAQRATLGGVSGGIELGSEALSNEPYNPQRIAEATAFGAVSAKPTQLVTTADKLASNIVNRVRGRPIAEPTPGTETPAGTRDTATQSDTTIPPVEEVIRTGAERKLNERDAKLFKEDLDKQFQKMADDEAHNQMDNPEWNKEDYIAKMKRRVTMGLEPELEHDILLNDKDRLRKLGQIRPFAQFYNKAFRVLTQGAMDEEEARIVQSFWEGNPNKGTIGYKAREAPKGFPTNGSFEEQIAYFKKHVEGLNYAVKELEMSNRRLFPILRKVKNEYRSMGRQAVREGVLDSLRRDYVTHFLNFSDSALNKQQQKDISDYIKLNHTEPRFNRDYTRARVFRTIRDLERAIGQAGEHLGIDVRGIKVEKDIGKIMESYKKTMGKAIIEKTLVNKLKTIKLDGNAYQGRQGELPLATDNYEFGFRNNYVKFTGTGSEVLKDVMVHPDFKDVLGFAFLQEDPGEITKALKAISMLAKTVNTVASLFHAQSLFVATSTAAPGKALKEIFTLGEGRRAALRELEHNGANEKIKLFARNGLEFMTEDIKQSIIGDIAGTADKKITDLLTGTDKRIVRKLSDPLEKHFLNHINRFTWDYMHSAGKFMLADHWFTTIKAKNPHLSDDAIAKEVSSFVNNTLGGLNWLQVANQVENKFLKGLALKAFKLQGREWAQILLFAPDWTVSTLRSFTRALPKELMKPQNWKLREGIKGVMNPATERDLARRYVLTTGLLWATILNGFNMAFSGHPMWENKDPTRVDLGDGTSMQPAKHSMEFPEAVMDPEKFAGNKLGFIPKAVVTMTTGKQYPSPNAPMVKDNTAFGRALHSVKAGLPFQYSAAAAAPPGEKAKRAISSFLGFPIYGQTDKAHSSAEVRMERKMNRNETARENKIKKQKQ